MIGNIFTRNIFNRTSIITTMALLLVLATAALAQDAPTKPTQLTAKSPAQLGKMPPGRSMGIPPPNTESYPDSVEFKALWKQLYPIIRPTKSVRERFDGFFKSPGNLHNLKMHQVDSAEAYKNCVAALDTTMLEQSYFNLWRKDFTAAELKQIVPFIKTEAGKHFMDVAPSLTSGTSSQVDGYVRRTMMSTITPMQKPLPTPDPNDPATRPRTMMRDSLGRPIPQGSPKIMRDSLGRPIYPGRDGMKRDNQGQSAPPKKD